MVSKRGKGENDKLILLNIHTYCLPLFFMDL